MKRAFKQGIWKAEERERCNRKQRKRQPEREEEERVEIAHLPLTIPVPLEGKRQQVPGTPARSPQRNLDTLSQRHSPPNLEK
jgi:hypothetical protein